ncbi:lipopolysaccharide biosynthesis protein [Deinococcus aquatilis]|uniref:lipopolysaccharide biosynthesis protein n=1 Tax=Deinococcus aquatilis TaxID=519440 RepID=UPI000382D7AC|nr:hypothetical protein [Deinococcus aquatilis]
MTISDQQLRRASQITFISTLMNFAVLTLQLLVITPQLIRTVGTEINGAWVGSGDLLLWLQAFDFGLTNYAIQRMSAAQAREDLSEVSGWFSATLAMLTVLALLIVLLGPLAANVVYRPFDLAPGAEAELRSAFVWGLGAVALTIVSYAFTGLARALQAPTMTMASVILGSVLGLAVSWWALTHGAGVKAVAYGMVVRAAVNLAGGLLAFSLFHRQNLVQLRMPGRVHLREGLAVMPYSGFGALGYAVSNQSDNFLVGSLFGANAATQFNTMRRAADVARSIIETLGYANFAAFSHVFARDGAAGSVLMYRRLLNLHSLLSLALCGGFIVLNEWFMGWWVGPRFYLGGAVNVLMALQIFFTTRSYLHNTLNRGMDTPQFAFVMLVVEAITKVLLVLLIARAFGIPALLLVALGVAALSMMIMARRNAARLGKLDWQWVAVTAAIGLIGFAQTIHLFVGLTVLIVLTGGLFLMQRREVTA